MELDIVKSRGEFEGPHYLITTSDEKILFLRSWKPEKPSETAILIFHGITGHSGPYNMLGIPVSEAGFSIFGLDLRGHGLSDGKRGDYPSRERLIKDLCESVEFLKGKFSKIILLGHSLGNLVALEALENCKHIDGLIFVSVGRTIKPDAYPKMSIWEKLKIVFNVLFAYRKPVLKYEREGLTGLDDPLRVFSYTPRFMNILSVRRFIKKFKFSEKLDFPVFVGIGEHDEIFAVDAAQAFYDEVPSDNKEFAIIPGAKHAEYPEGCWSPLITWLKKNFK